MRRRRSTACLATLLAALGGAACAPAVAGQASASPSKAEVAALRSPLVREGPTRWSYARVAALGEAGVEVTMADGQKRTIGARNVVALD